MYIYIYILYIYTYRYIYKIYQDVHMHCMVSGPVVGAQYRRVLCSEIGFGSLDLNSVKDLRALGFGVYSKPHKVGNRIKAK